MSSSLKMYFGVSIALPVLIIDKYAHVLQLALSGRIDLLISRLMIPTILIPTVVLFVYRVEVVSLHVCLLMHFLNTVLIKRIENITCGFKL